MQPESTGTRGIVRQQPSNPEQMATSLRVFALLLAALFATELAVMELFSSFFPRFDVVSAGLIDALLLILFLAWPLWYFVVRALAPAPGAAGSKSQESPVGLLLKVLGTILLIELLVMLIQPYLLPPGTHHLRDLVDAGLLVLFAATPLWWLLFRPELRRSRLPLTDMFGTPLGLYVLLLFTVFLADLLQYLLRPFLAHDVPGVSITVVDSFVSSLLLAPLLWLFVARPLRKEVLSVKARAGAIHEQLIDAVVTTDTRGRIESFNPAAERIFGYRAAEMTGRPAAMLFQDDSAEFADLARDTVAAAELPSPRIHEVVGRRRDTSLLTMEVSISQVLLEGRAEFLLVMRDITSRIEAAQALKESELRFRQIFEQTEDAIIFFKLGSCSIIDVNTTTVELFGYGKSELFDAGLEGICRPAEIDRLGHVIRSIRPGAGVHLDDVAARRKDGSELIVSMRGKVMIVQGVELIYCTFRDVTARVRLEQEAREIQSRLIQANKMTSLGLLVSGVAHEINNPNNFILANAQLLSRAWEDARIILREHYRENGEFFVGGVPFSELDAHSPQLFAGIVDGSRRINAIINNLKGFARQDRVVADRSVDVNQVAAAAISLVHHELVRFTENFHLELAKKLPPVTGSSQQIGQVIVNLLMNACQALPDKRCGIWLETAYDAAAAQVIRRPAGSPASEEPSA
jgi:PAS domain S-box-containing protein